METGSGERRGAVMRLSFPGLSDCARAVTGSARLMGSGAGHDGVMVSRAMPIGMVFIRCRAGLSHHPDEYAEADDIEAGIDVLVEFLKRRST